MDSTANEPNTPSVSTTQPLPQQPSAPSASETEPSRAPRKARPRKQAEAKLKRPGAQASSSPVDPSKHSPQPPSRIPQIPLQPYPGPPYPLMNPAYPMNNAPFPPQHQPGYSPHPASMNGASGPGIPGHAPQYYPMHAGPYPPPHSYGYPYQQMLVYGAPRPDMPQGLPSPVQAVGEGSGKRKRKPDSGKGETDDEGLSGSDRPPSQATPQHAPPPPVVDIKKRTKTQRACDSCRSRKIRCDILPESEPQCCQHCKQYGFECTFFLPITETRFKKKKLEEEAVNAEKEKATPTESKQDAASSSRDVHLNVDAPVYGSTSPTHLLHSQPTISSRVYESYDVRHHITWEVTTTGEGLIRVEKPSTQEHPLAAPKPADLRLDRDVVEKLLNTYFTEIAPILPVVTQAEFLATSSPPPILLYSMCLVAAGRREVPQTVFSSLRYIVNTVIKSEEVLSTSSLVNVQALLILCMMGDCHSQYVPTALSALWIRLGTAIRMAQDIGLHRAESASQNIELRRRVWAACVISDRWMALGFGHPHMIDVQDCDVRLPSSGDPSDLYMVEMVRLSVLLGRVLKAVYSPSGLTHTTDDMLQALLADIEAWKNNLPESLRYDGPDTSLNSGLLHLLYSCVCMIFWRVFMRISYSCPAHIKFAMTVPNWLELVKLTGEAIDWLDTHEKVYDVWFLVAYAATSCALVQYHTWARRMQADASTKLRKLRDCVRRWETSSPPEHLSTRRKTAEIISLLYEATQVPQAPSEAPALNPTGGVKHKPAGAIEFRKDPSRPGGGVFVVHGPLRAKDFEGVPPGTIINSSDEEEEGEVSALAVSPVSSANDRTLLLSPSPFAPPLPVVPAARSGMASSLLPSTGAEVRQQTQSGTAVASGTAAAPMVNITPLNFPNVNPAMNWVGETTPGTVQVMNVLDMPEGSGVLEQLALADIGFLEGIPGSMFDWGQWEAFFNRLSNNAGLTAEGNGGTGGSAPYPQAQSGGMVNLPQQQVQV